MASIALYEPGTHKFIAWEFQNIPIDMAASLVRELAAPTGTYSVIRPDESETQDSNDGHHAPPDELLEKTK